MILGHADEEVVAAIQEVAAKRHALARRLN